MLFKPAKYLGNPHLQTIFPLLVTAVKPPYLREEFFFEDGDFTEIVWSQDPAAKDYKHVTVLFHGLGGSIDSHYIQGMMNNLKEIGHLCVLMHFRGCGIKDNNSIRSYHAGETEDARAFISYLQKRFSQARLHAIGYSLGGNMLLKLLSSYAYKTPLFSAVAVSTPLELETCAHHLSKGFAKVYQRYLLKDLKAKLLIKSKRLDLITPLGLSSKHIKNIKSIYEFDDVYTAKIHGFKDALDYYDKNSSKQFLKGIKIPTLMIHAKDDPFMPSSVLPSKEELSQMISFELNENGGHVGFVEGTLFSPGFWLEKRVKRFFQEEVSTKSATALFET